MKGLLAYVSSRVLVQSSGIEQEGEFAREFRLVTLEEPGGWFDDLLWLLIEKAKEVEEGGFSLTSSALVTAVLALGESHFVPMAGIRERVGREEFSESILLDSWSQEEFLDLAEAVYFDTHVVGMFAANRQAFAGQGPAVRDELLAHILGYA
jgi:hypothetical protein